MLVTVRGFTPQVGQGCYLAPNATLVGDVVLGDRCTVWFNAIIRGDVHSIRIGNETNIQDGTVVHATYQRCGTHIGNRVSVGHSVILHGCEVGDGTLIGMGSILMDLSKIGKHCLVGAGSLVTEESVFEDGWLIYGRPAKAVRKLTDQEIARLEKSADNYLFYKGWYETR